MLRLSAGVIMLAGLAGWYAAREERALTERFSVHTAPDYRIVESPELAPSRPSSPSGGLAELVIPRSPDGHFYVEGRVNGAPVRFMVDTGATTIALTRADARAAGLVLDDGDFTATAQGVGGSVAVAPVTLGRVAAGSFESTAVRAAVVRDAGLDISLLGQNWLSQVGRVTIERDRMILR